MKDLRQFALQSILNAHPDKAETIKAALAAMIEKRVTQHVEQAFSSAEIPELKELIVLVEEYINFVPPTSAPVEPPPVVDSIPAPVDPTPIPAKPVPVKSVPVVVKPQGHKKGKNNKGKATDLLD